MSAATSLCRYILPWRWHIKLGLELCRYCSLSTPIRLFSAFAPDTMSTILSWNPFFVCEMLHRSPGFCCGTTKKGEPCKNSTKVEDTKIGHQRLTTLAREPFDLSNLQSKLCDVAKEYLCEIWHRQRQADQLGQQWYEAAVRNQARVPRGFSVTSPTVVTHLGQCQTSSASRTHLAESDNNHLPPPHRQVSPVPLSNRPEPVQPTSSFVTAAMLRAYSVPWHVSPTRPAILSSATNIWANVQDLTLQSLTLSQEVDNIHCVFCLTEDENHANESVILRCGQCRALSHLSCAEEWLKKRIQALARHAVCGKYG